MRHQGYEKKKLLATHLNQTATSRRQKEHVDEQAILVWAKVIAQVVFVLAADATDESVVCLYWHLMQLCDKINLILCHIYTYI